MKKYKIIFWIATSIIFIFEGVIPAFTSHSEVSVTAITRLGYPFYFISLLTVFKVLGSLALVIPRVPERVKELAYVGFSINFISASVSIWIVKGLSWAVLFPMIFMVILAVSYVYRHKIHVLKHGHGHA